MKALVIHPDGRTEPVELTETEDGTTGLVAAVGGPVEYLPEAFHQLDHWEVAHLEDWAGEPVNLHAGRMVGMPWTCQPLRGPVVIVPLPEGQDNRAEREHQRHFFGILDAVDSGFCTAAEAGIGALIRVDAA